MTRRESAKLRPAWVGHREAEAEEVAVVIVFPPPLPVELVEGFPLLRPRLGLDPWRPRQFLDDVLEAGHSAVVCLAFVVRFTQDSSTWNRTAAHWPYEMRRALLCSPELFEVAPFWKADTLPPFQRQADLQRLWLALMGVAPRVNAVAASRLWLQRAEALPAEWLKTVRGRR